MTLQLDSKRARVADEAAAQVHAYEQGWTDGLPIVAPTAERVEALLAHAGLAPRDVVGVYAYRNRSIPAEKVAISAVMAGCAPEHFPVVIAAIEALMDPEFHLNHLASTSSPWPVFIVNGPIAASIGLASGAGMFGPGNAANARIGRAISLVLANCLEARVGGMQQGVLGAPARVGGMVVAEDESCGWTPVSVLQGLPAGTSAITVCPHFMGGPQQVAAYPEECFPTAVSLASLIAERFAEYNTAGMELTHLVLLSPAMQRRFAADGWDKARLRGWLRENVRVSFAKLKRRPGPGGLWPVGSEEGADGGLVIQPQDHRQFWHYGQPERSDPLPEEIEGYRPLSKQASDFLIAVAGDPDGPPMACLARSYPYVPVPVTKAIRPPA